MQDHQQCGEGDANGVVSHPAEADFARVTLSGEVAYIARLPQVRRIVTIDDLITAIPRKNSFYKAGFKDARPRLRRTLGRVQGITVFLQSVQDVRIGGRASRTQYQYTLEDANLDELREFASAYPEEGTPLLPDPLCDGGDNATLEDIDLDGTPDTLMTRSTTGVFSGYDKYSLLVDLDEDYVARTDAPDAPYEAELALLVTNDGTFVWYDTDGDTRGAAIEAQGAELRYLPPTPRT